MNILICGHQSFTARNFVKKLESAGHIIWCFSRGEIKQKNNIITGPVTEINKNPYLKEVKVDVVVNFILLDKQSIEDNLRYIDALCRWCESANVKRLINMSSISALPNEAELITESTPIDEHPELKGVYGAVKVAIDKRLISWASEHQTVKLVIIRSGFITAADKKKSLTGIAKMFPGGFAVLMGNNSSTLPIVDRDELQLGLQNAIETEEPLDVYLMVDKGMNTKRSYLKTIAPNAKIIPLPKCMVILATNILKTIGVLDERKHQMVTGLFKIQKFDNSKTYNRIHNR